MKNDFGMSELWRFLEFCEISKSIIGFNLLSLQAVRLGDMEEEKKRQEALQRALHSKQVGRDLLRVYHDPNSLFFRCN